MTDNKPVTIDVKSITAAIKAIDLKGYSRNGCEHCSYQNRQNARHCGACGHPTRLGAQLLIGARTVKGRHAENQDKALLRTLRGPQGGSSLLCMVADGVGGGPAGTYASRRAISIAYAQLSQTLYIGEPASEHAWHELLKLAIGTANRQLHREAVDHPQLSGMGTTLSVAIITNSQIHLGHVGDSRIYRLTSDGSIQRLTTDHTLAERLVSYLPSDSETIRTSHHIRLNRD